MEWYRDSIACLEVAELLLLDIEEKQREAIRDNNILPFLKVSIKNCLENCRSPLDYAANFIFDTYCREKCKPEKLKKISHKIQFPIVKDPQNFNGHIHYYFEGLKNKKIIQIFESSQKYNVTWLDDLTKLVNENKHRNLTLQNINNTTRINHGSLGGRINFYGTTFSGNTNDLVIDGKMYSGFEMTKAFSNIDATFDRKYMFADLNKDVLQTLQTIVIETRKVIDALHDVL